MRVFTVFFSALAGFGLKRLADNSADHPATWPPRESLCCFAAALFLLLRFLFGSANHLWLDFLGDPPARKKSGKGNGSEIPGAMILDCFFLAGIGTGAMLMCYRPDIRSFLEWNGWLGLAVAVMVLVDLLLRRKFGEKPRLFWILWLPLNLLYASTAAHIARLYGEQPGWWWPLMLVLVSGLFFLVDLRVQAFILDETKYDPAGDWQEKRYEQCVRVPTVFFSMLMGFGLKRLVEYPLDGGHWTGSWEQIACFVIALALFMRILFGSANHLWLNFLKSPPPDKRHGRALLMDCSFLALIGTGGLILCYKEDVQGFAYWSGILAVGVVGIDLIDAPIRKWLTGQNQRNSELWKQWLAIDSIQAVAGLLLGFLLGLVHRGDSSYIWLLGAYALIGLLLLYWDLRTQLVALNE